MALNNKFIFSQWWRLNIPMPAWLGSRPGLQIAAFSLCPQMVFRVCVCVRACTQREILKDWDSISSSQKATNRIGLRPPTLWPFLNFTYLLKALLSNTVELRVRALSYEFFRDTVQCITVALFYIFTHLLKSSFTEDGCMLIATSAFSHFCCFGWSSWKSSIPQIVDGKGSILTGFSGNSGRSFLIL